MAAKLVPYGKKPIKVSLAECACRSIPTNSPAANTISTPVINQPKPCTGTYIQPCF